MRFSVSSWAHSMTFAAAALAIGGGAFAQTSMLEGIVKGASDINIYTQFIRPPKGPVVPRHGFGAGGFGFELSYDFSDTVVNEPKNAVHLQVGGVPLRLEAGVGYDQSSAYKFRNGGADLRMSLRDLPAFSVYISPMYGLVSPAKEILLGGTPYFGLRTGYLTFQSAHAYIDTLSTYKLDGNAFQLGPIAGIFWDFGDFSLFGETSYLMRNFPSVDWSGPGSKPGTPAVLPRGFDLSSFNFYTGLQIGLKRHARMR